MRGQDLPHGEGMRRCHTPAIGIWFVETGPSAGEDLHVLKRYHDLGGEHLGGTHERRGDRRSGDEAGNSKMLTIDMAPGHYAIVCNLNGHYAAGMHQDFWVTPA
jgi:hypothetical protein